DDVEPNVEARRRLAANPSHPSSVARAALRRQIPEVGAQCVNRARWDLCGGLPAMGVPTAISAGGHKRHQGNSDGRFSFCFFVTFESLVFFVLRQQPGWRSSEVERHTLPKAHRDQPEHAIAAPETSMDDKQRS